MKKRLKDMSYEERFWAKVDKDGRWNERLKSHCWEFNGGLSAGYGMFADGKKLVGETRAHRISFALQHGPISDGKLVLHKCDNPCCVNPDHLRQGTHGDNMNEMAERGRQKSKALPIEVRLELVSRLDGPEKVQKVIKDIAETSGYAACTIQSYCYRYNRGHDILTIPEKIKKIRKAKKVAKAKKVKVLSYHEKNYRPLRSKRRYYILDIQRNKQFVVDDLGKWCKMQKVSYQSLVKTNQYYQYIVTRKC